MRVRYKQTLLGIGWLVFQPLLTVAVYSILFGYIAKMPSEGVPYPLFLLTALLPWQFISRLVTEGSQCITSNSNLIGKIYFPRLILPLASAGSLSLDLLIGLGVALIILVLFGYYPGPQVVFLPLIACFAAVSGLAAALLIAPLDVAYRDVRMVLPLLLQMVMFVSPVFYSSSVIPEKLRWLFDMNPIAVIATSVRWALLNNGTPPSLHSILGSSAVVAVTLIVGLSLFVRAEARFADRL